MLQSLEVMNGATLANMLHRGAQRMLGELPEAAGESVRQRRVRTAGHRHGVFRHRHFRFQTPDSVAGGRGHLRSRARWWQAGRTRNWSRPMAPSHRWRHWRRRRRSRRRRCCSGTRSSRSMASPCPRDSRAVFDYRRQGLHALSRDGRRRYARLRSDVLAQGAIFCLRRRAGHAAVGTRGRRSAGAVHHLALPGGPIHHAACFSTRCSAILCPRSGRSQASFSAGRTADFRATAWKICSGASSCCRNFSMCDRTRQ